MQGKGVILSNTYRNAIIRIGYSEKYVEHAVSGSPFRAGYSSKIMASALSPTVQEDALTALLIFGKAYIQMPDNFRLDKLEKEGLIQTFYYEHHTPCKEEEAMQLKGLIIDDLRRQKVPIRSEEFDELLEMSHSSRLTEALLEKSRYSLLLLKKKSRELEIKKQKVDEKLRKMDMMNQSCYEISSLKKCSEDNDGIPSFTRITPLKKSRITVQPQLPPQNALQAYKICLPEMTLPKLQKIEQVLRLRENKRIEDFRLKILEWAGFLRKGDKESEEKIRKDIKKANQEIAKIKTSQKVATITTVLGIPAFFGDLFVTGGAVGGTLLAGSIGTLYYEHGKKKKYKWLLIGT